jgi:hypothetical protein
VGTGRSDPTAGGHRLDGHQAKQTTEWVDGRR